MEGEPSTPEITPAAPKPKGRKRLLVIIIVAVIVLAAVSILAIILLGSASVVVTSNSQYLAAGNSTTFSGSVTPPALVSAGTLSWNFGDGQTSANGGNSVSHTYANVGSYLVLASSPLSNGKTADNSQALFPLLVGPGESVTPALGTTTALGALSVNDTLSSAGGRIVGVGGHIALVGAVAQPPSFEFDDNTNVTTNAWTNYTWQVTKLTIDFGDGSAVATNNSRVDNATKNTLVADAYTISHTYSNAGLYAVTLTVTTQNFSATQTNGVPMDVYKTPVSPAQTKTTTVLLTVAAGSYKILKYSGDVINPGIITNMEAVTGGYTTLDPALDYESTGYEIIANVYETLLAYSGTKTDQFVSVIAADPLPTVGHGISQDFKNYTFHIRSNLKFSNGDPVTAWDVKYSMTRTMLLNSGSPFPPGWILSQFFIPGTFIAGNTPADTYNWVNGAIEVNNATQNVTFHLITPAAPLLFFQVLADQLGSSIVDHAWLETYGHLTWTAQGFVDYENYSFLANYVSAWRNGAVGSGPFKIDYVANPNAVVLVPNPNFTPVPGVPAATVNKVVLQYVADDSTRELSLESGQADIAGITPAHFDVAKRLQGAGLIQVQFMATLNMFWWNFNLEIYQSGSGQNPYGNMVPSNFFVDMNMRKAFAYAFDYGNYLDQILGNKKFNATFGLGYNGIIPKGMVGYQDLSFLNVYDMNLAHQFYNKTLWVQQHGWANSGFTLAINVETADTVNRIAAAAWAASIEKLAPNIKIVVKPISFEEEIINSVPHLNPMAIYYLGWLPDYPFPTDYTFPMEYPADSPVTSTTPDGGTYPNANGWNIQYLQADPSASTVDGQTQINASIFIRGKIADSLSAPNATNIDAVVNDSQQAQIAAALLWMTVPTIQQYTFFSFRTWITGMEAEQNPVLGGTDLLYDLITKPSSATPAALAVTWSPTAGFIAPMLAIAFASPASTIALAGAAARASRERRP